MRDPDEFDVFYKEARERLLVQTFALTSDLRVARSAVRDTFVVAWHHWRKISRSGDPEGWARPYAWQHAQRRHTARPWHREKGLAPEVAATLEALTRLTHPQRRALLLTHLASASLDQMARELGLTVEETTRQLQSATTKFAMHREIPSTAVAAVLRGLGDLELEARWPRASIIRRTGSRRRRLHTGVGVLGAVAAVTVAGVVVTDPGGVRPTLDREPIAVSAPRHSPTAAPAPEESDVLPSSAMLSGTTVADLLPGRKWEEGSTHDNTHGNGLVMPCQAARYADPRLVDALVREVSTPRGSEPRRTVVASTEASRHEKAASQALDRLTGWFGACTEERMQLLSTSTVDGVGDEALQFVLRDWNDPVTTTVIGVARTGRFVVATSSSVRSARIESPEGHARLLAGAVAGVCDLDGGGGCPAKEKNPRLRPRDALPAGTPATMLVEYDLPPVSGVDAPWVGTRPLQPRGQNAAATRCDRTSFSGKIEGKAMQDAATRTFLIPKAKLPVEFGLTETVGRLPDAQARTFVATIRRKMAACADRELGTEVFTAASRGGTREELAVWHVTVELSESRSVKYFMAVARSRGQLLQLGFIPAPGVEMGRGAFLALAERGLERLRSGG